MPDLSVRVFGTPIAQPRTKVSDDSLVDAYVRLGNVHKVASEVGLNHASVHERLVKLGKMKGVRVFSDEEKDFLKRHYLHYRSLGRLDDLARHMGRTKHFICRQARALGLTDKGAPKPFAGRWKYMTEEQARLFMDEFKASPLTLGRWCRSKGIGESGFWKTMTRFFPDEWEHVIESKAPASTKYRRGRQFEYRVRDALKKAGYFVLRSPQSKSPLDLVAVKPDRVLFVQCKVSDALPPREWNALVELARSSGATPVLARRTGVRGLEYRELLATKVDGRSGQPWKVIEP